MKKLALLMALMMFIALTTYAADIAVSVSGKAELTFGIDLNTNMTGMKNYSESAINFTLVSGTSEKGKAEDGAVYGYIKVSGWKTAVETTAWALSDGDVSAKIIFPGGWVDILSKINSLNYINVVQDDDDDKDNADKGVNDSIASTNGGFILGLSFAPVTVETSVFSNQDWTADNEYGAGLKVVLDVAPIKVEGGFELALNYAADTSMGAGAKVTATIDPIGVYAGLDVLIEPAPADAIMEYGFGASLAVAGIKVNVDGSYNEALDGLDVRAKVDAGGLVAGLGLALTVELFNLTGIVGADLDADAEYAVVLDASFATPTIKPYATVRYGTYTVTDNTYVYVADAVFALTVGAEMYLIPNVTFDAKYASSNLTAGADAGTITFLTKIAL